MNQSGCESLNSDNDLWKAENEIAVSNFSNDLYLMFTRMLAIRDNIELQVQSPATPALLSLWWSIP